MALRKNIKAGRIETNSYRALVIGWAPANAQDAVLDSRSLGAEQRQGFQFK